MTGLARFISAGVLWGVFWVYGFSIVVGQRPIFSYLNQYLVQNSLVQELDRKLADSLDALRSKIIASKDEGIETIKRL